MINSIETSDMRIWAQENILYCVFADKTEIDINVARCCVDMRIVFSQGKSYPCFIDMKGVRSATKEAREYMATEGAKYVKAGALLVDSSLSKMLGNLFLSVNKPVVPTKIFDNENEAKAWLKQYL